VSRIDREAREDAGSTGPIALLAPSQAEIYHSFDLLEERRRDPWGGGRISMGRFEGRDLLVAWTGVGITLTALSCQYLCDRYRPRMILFAGIGGGLKEGLRSGDKVLADDVLQWDMDASQLGIPKATFPGEKDSRGQALQRVGTDLQLRQAARSLYAGELETGLHISGNSFVKDKRSLAKEYDAWILDMEGFGVALAGLLNGVPVLYFGSSPIPWMEGDLDRYATSSIKAPGNRPFFFKLC